MPAKYYKGIGKLQGGYIFFAMGKRSASDHIHEATNYINYLQNNIQELEIKRDTLKKLLKEQNFKTGSCSKTLPIIVTVKSCRVGIEVSITGDFTIPLSSVLQILVEEGLNVISSICTKVEGRSHYAIQSEVMDVSGVSLDMLQRKLGYTINHWINYA
ncbi:transcription factor bHLH118-like [Olea europaea var. sylvestris]|uniref:transcription factor bHLH118-like n=1 Tax=Olea europaea var. sylvestris TaxID=158386 RepID=UPI000C1D0310|nr:transcription factor bHLH118-like [Olea europaea var. sylvestris]